MAVMAVMAVMAEMVVKVVMVVMVEMVVKVVMVMACDSFRDWSPQVPPGSNKWCFAPLRGVDYCIRSSLEVG
eukprot:4627631-Alexandrium_andersonii.AAC.1